MMLDGAVLGCRKSLTDGGNENLQIVGCGIMRRRWLLVRPFELSVTGD